jgi:uncharacterized protein
MTTICESAAEAVAAPDGSYQASLTVTDKVEMLTWSTEPFETTTELIGTGAAHLFVEIDTDDTNLILRLWDEAPGGSRQLVTTGYLKASHRELDDRTTEGNPYHPHTRAVPVEPGKVEEYVLRLYPLANAIRPGHRLVGPVEARRDPPLRPAHVRDHARLADRRTGGCRPGCTRPATGGAGLRRGVARHRQDRLLPDIA